jgi:hypothetical protein
MALSLPGEFSVVDEKMVRGKSANYRGLQTPGKEFDCKHSAGPPREIEVFFHPNHTSATHAVPGVILFHGGGSSYFG